MRYPKINRQVKLGLAFATTTLTYLAIRVTGLFPTLFNWDSDSTSLDGINTDKSLITNQNSIVTQISNSEIYSLASTPFILDTPILDIPIYENLLVEFQDTLKPKIQKLTNNEDLIEDTTINSGQRRLLSTPIPVDTTNQLIEAGYPYEYSLDLPGNYTFLRATQTTGALLPAWLELEFKEISKFYVSGDAHNLLTEGNLTFVANGFGGLLILNTSDPSNPSLVSTCNIPGEAYAIKKQNNFVIIAAYNLGIQIIDVSDIYNPIIVGNFDTPGYARSLDLQNNLTAVADFYSLQFINITIKNNPSLVGIYNTSDILYDVVMSGNYAYLALNNFGLKIINFANLSNPIEVGALRLAAAFGITLQNNIIYVASDIDGVNLVNVTNVANPTLIANFNTPGSATKVVVKDTLTGVADQSAGFHLIDTSILSNPVLIGSFDTSGLALGLAMKDNFFFIADFTSGVSIINLKKGKLSGIPPLSIAGLTLFINISSNNIGTLVESYPIQLTIDLFPRTIISSVTDYSLSPGETRKLTYNSNGLFINDGNTVLKLDMALADGGVIPTFLTWTLQPILKTSFPTQYNALCVRTQDDKTYISGNSNLFQIIDNSNINNLQQIASLNLVSTSSNFEIYDDTSLYIADNNFGIRLANISNRYNPIIEKSYNISGLTWQLAVKEKNIVVTANGMAGFQIININNSTRIANHPTIGDAIALRLKDDLLFIGGQTSGIEIYDISNLSNPLFVGSFPFNYVLNIFLQDNLLFIAGGPYGLGIANITLPTNPISISNYRIGYISDVVVSNNIAFMTDEYYGVRMVDVSIPSSPTLLASIKLPGTAYGITLKGSTIYIADGSGGVQILDVSQWQLTMTPTAADVGNYQLRLTATDPLGGSDSYTFTVRVEGPPQLNGVVPQLFAKVGQAFNYFLAQGLFTDPNFDPMSFSTLNLPSWLGFSFPIISGTPGNQNTGNFSITISATDNKPGTVPANVTFYLYVDFSPIVNQPIPAKVAGVGLPFQYQVSAQTFLDQDGDPVTLDARLFNQLPLPAWLVFNSTLRQFFGTPSQTDLGSNQIAVTATDPYNGQATTIFSLLVEHFPQVAQLLPELFAGVDSFFSWRIPGQTFVDADDPTLSYQITPIPNWASFDSIGLVLSGTPRASDSGTLLLRLTATDPSGGSAYTNLTIIVTYFPSVAQQIAQPPLLTVGKFFQYQISNSTFSDPGQTLTYSSTKDDNSALPPWLVFFSQNITYIGIPNSSDQGVLTIKLIATDTRNLQASALIKFIIGPNLAPVIKGTISNQDAPVRSIFKFCVPPDIIEDPNGDSLSYTAQADGNELRGWLRFNNETLCFSGKPEGTDTNYFTPRTISIALIATDPQGLPTTLYFSINVTEDSDLYKAMKILGSIGSIITLTLLIKKLRYIVINPWNRRKTHKGETDLFIGQTFNFPLDLIGVSRKKTGKVQLKRPNPPKKYCPTMFSRLEFIPQSCRSERERWPGDEEMPAGFMYDNLKHSIRTKENCVVPETDDSVWIWTVKDSDKIVQAWGKYNLKREEEKRNEGEHHRSVTIREPSQRDVEMTTFDRPMSPSQYSPTSTA